MGISRLQLELERAVANLQNLQQQQLDLADRARIMRERVDDLRFQVLRQAEASHLRPRCVRTPRVRPQPISPTDLRYANR